LEVTAACQTRLKGGPTAIFTGTDHIRACKRALFHSWTLSVEANTKQSGNILSNSLVIIRLRLGFMAFLDEPYYYWGEGRKLTHHEVEKSRGFITSQRSTSSLPNVPRCFQWSAHLICGVAECEAASFTVIISGRWLSKHDAPLAHLECGMEQGLSGVSLIEK
jgi:hypothetical protein